MANQLDLSSVLYVNNNPLKVAETYSVLTSDILVYEVDNPLYPGINSATQYYNNTSNQLAYITYYSTKTVNSLLAAANVGVASLVKVPVKSINKIPFAKGIDFLFPANGVQLREISTNVTEIYFKGSYYITDTPIATIIAQANTGGGGGGTNPTNLFIPYNDAGVFEDSYLKNDITPGAETLSAIFSGSELGLKLEFWDNFYAFGDFTWYNNGTSFIVDDAARVVKTFYRGQDTGIKVDFANREFIFGDYYGLDPINPFAKIYFYCLNDAVQGVAAGIKNESGWEYIKGFAGQLELGLFQGNPTLLYGWSITGGYISSIYNGGSVGLILDYSQQLYTLGDLNGNQLAVLSMDVANQKIYSTISGLDLGIKMDVNNGQYYFGDYDFVGVYGTAIKIDENGTEQIIKTTYLGNDIGLKLRFNPTGEEYLIGDYNNINNNTYLYINDKQANIYWFSDNVPHFNDNGTGNMISVAPTVSPTGDYLVLNINGNNYYIELNQ